MDTRIVVIDSSISEMKAAMRDLEKDYVINYFASIDDFFRVLEKSVAPPKDGDGDLRDYEASASLVPIDLFIISLELLPTAPVPWLLKTQDKLKSLGAHPPGDITKFVFTSFENDSLRLASFQHHYLYDVIFKPLDQPLLLQKIEMIANLPKIVSPGHLYSHKTSGEIELSKESQVSELSEFGVTILNPTPVHIGAFANFRMAFPDESYTVKFIGRCYRCEPADVPNYHKCSFSYFGISPSDIRHQRVLFQRIEQKRDNSNFEDENPETLTAEAKALRIRQQMMARAKGGPAGKGGATATENAARNDATPSGPAKDVVVIDMDRFNIEAITSSFDQNFPGVNLHTFPTMAFFNKKIAKQTVVPDESGGEGKKEEEPWTSAAFSFGSYLSFQIDVTNGQMTSIHPTPRPDDLVCGHQGIKFLTDNTYWRKLVSESEREELDEFLNYTRYGEKSDMDILLTNTDRKKRWFSLSAKLMDTETMQIKILDESKKNKKPGIVTEDEDDDLSKKLSKIDLVVVNTAYIPTKFSHWKESFIKQVTQAGLLPPSKKINFVLLKPENSSLKAKDFCQAEICGFFSKPVDRRLFVESVAVAINYQTPEFSKMFLKSLPYLRTIELGRPANIRRVSEFGVVISNKNPLHPGTLLRLHSPILTDQKEEGTLARCFGFEVDPDNEDQFLIHFLFYGVKDQALKRIRTMIREEYVQKKNKK